MAREVKKVKVRNLNIGISDVVRDIKRRKAALMQQKKEEASFSERLFKQRIFKSYALNKPVFKVYSDFFNYLSQNKKAQKETGITFIAFQDSGVQILDTVNLHEPYGCKKVIIRYEGMTIFMEFDIYKQHERVMFALTLASDVPTYIDADELYDNLFGIAINFSQLKGAYLTFSKNSLEWERGTILDKDFSDIYLPAALTEELKLYFETYNHSNKLMRYLMAGFPGTGKTESTVILASMLNKLGVTVIKTPVCDILSDKVDLAELLAPCIIILDDIDLALGSRSSGMVNPERLQVFLDVLDGTDKVSDKVGIIATTNSIQLLDLAAQRPGRFDKILSFDSLTKDNIKNIILKSLNYNFSEEQGDEIVAMFIDESVVDLLHETRVTGSYIYNFIKMLNLRIQVLNKNISEISASWICDEIRAEVTKLDKIKKSNFLSDKINLEGGSDTIGFAAPEPRNEEYKFDEQQEVEWRKGTSKDDY